MLAMNTHTNIFVNMQALNAIISCLTWISLLRISR